MRLGWHLLTSTTLSIAVLYAVIGLQVYAKTVVIAPFYTALIKVRCLPANTESSAE